MQKPTYEPDVIRHNPMAELEQRDVLYLYVFDLNKQKTIAYISFNDLNLHVCHGCAFGEYNQWHKSNPSRFSVGAYAETLINYAEAMQITYKNADRYKIIITKAGEDFAKRLPRLADKHPQSLEMLNSARRKIGLNDIEL